MSPRLSLLGLCAVLAVGMPACAYDLDGNEPAMAASGTVVEAAMNSPDHQTLVAAVKAAGLVDTLSGPGPFTVFAPTDAAFAQLPSGTVESLLQPANIEKLRSILTYHVVPGRVTSAELIRMIQAGGGSATMNTVQGDPLTARLSGGNVIIVDGSGGMATVTAADLIQANGVIHVTDRVSIPG